MKALSYFFILCCFFISITFFLYFPQTTEAQPKIETQSFKQPVFHGWRTVGSIQGTITFETFDWNNEVYTRILNADLEVNSIYGNEYVHSITYSEKATEGNLATLQYEFELEEVPSFSTVRVKYNTTFHIYNDGKIFFSNPLYYNPLVKGDSEVLYEKKGPFLLARLERWFFR